MESIHVYADELEDIVPIAVASVPDNAHAFYDSVRPELLWQARDQAAPLLQEAGPRRVAVVPLQLHGRVAALLWLEHPPPALVPVASAAGTQLLSSPDALRRLAFAVSFAISGSDDPPGQLSWLSGAVGRLAASASMQALLAELCGAVAAHVQRRFTLECSVQAALAQGQSAKGTSSGAAPVDAGSLGLMFKLEPGVQLDSYFDDSGIQGFRDADRFTSQALNIRPQSAIMSRRSLLTQDAPSGRALLARSTTVGGQQSPQASARSTLQASTCKSLAPQPAHLRSVRRSADFRQASATSQSAKSLSRSAPRSTGASASSVRALVGSSFVVSLSKAETDVYVSATSAAPPPRLHASAFPLQRTLLGAVLARRRKAPERLLGEVEAVMGACSGPRSAAAAAAVVEDLDSFVQDVHAPSRDVCLLLSAASDTAGHQPSFTGYHSSSAAGAGGSSSATRKTGSPGTSGGAAQSLVLLTLTGLPEGSALGLYVCFPKRLPAPLLEAVRAGGQELLEQALAGPVREQLCGPLAAEYSTLRTATPGSYAVMRSPSPTNPNGGADMDGQPAPVCVGAMKEALSQRRVTPASSVLAATATYYTQTTASDLSVSELDVASERYPSEHRSRFSTRTTGAGRLRGLSRLRNLLASAGPDGPPTPTGASTAPQPDSAGNSRDASLTMQLMAVGRGPFGTARQSGTDADVVMVNGSVDCTASNVSAFERKSSTLDGAVQTALITVSGTERGSSAARQQMDLLVSSFQATINTGGVLAQGFRSDLDNLELQGVLGRGGGGVVLRGLLNGSLHVAVKLMEMPDVEPESSETSSGSTDPADPAGTATAAKQLRARREMTRNAMELVVQSGCSHPNIVQFYSTFNHVVLRGRTPGDDISPEDACQLYLEAVPPGVGRVDGSARVTAILAEYCDAGSLGSALQSKVFPRRARSRSATTANCPFNLKDIYLTLLDVAMALRHLHAMNLVHRDLKPANLLLKSNPLDYRGFTVKLADFGFVLHLNGVAEDGTRFATVDQACGTVTHMAPECLPGKARVDASCDIYSFGVLMWEMVSSGQRPFPKVHPDNIPRMVYQGARPVFPPNVPEAYRALAHLCWCTTAARRPKATELVALLTGHLQSAS
ncbi:hypothetical protein HYH03_000316 [Edaphochlamys debaryana]|uniref:Protein kinase domain-containing protein n=1 Tax=Edaphochlamys debaryana TaxID=47281 RepID=A0A835YHA4_9CHLO|nr:hypothetical protein HYH03_000316 [Edaphochlamys debaryana]|eukprot:KAG2501817.1 hypothetical protein HYH03_000316 [Edaphochlamys debaryana]